MRYNGLTSIIRQTLDDGEWHDIFDLVRQTRAFVPPEVAVRAWGKRGNHSMTWNLHKGRRLVVIKAISALLHGRIPPAVEVKRENDRKIIAVRKLW